MASVASMNVESAVWASPGSVTFTAASLMTADFDMGGDVVEKSAGVDTAVADSTIVAIKGLLSIRFQDGATANSLLAKVGTEASMVVKGRIQNGTTGIQLTAGKARLQRVRPVWTHNSLSGHEAIFFCTSSDGSTLPISSTTY